VIVSDPARHPTVAFANLSTKPSRAADPPDDPASVSASEHPSLSRDSFIRYDEARLATADQLELLLKTKKLIPTKASPPSLVKKIQQALIASKGTKLEVQRVLSDQGYGPKPDPPALRKITLGPSE
jgi:hypothetical protein